MGALPALPSESQERLHRMPLDTSAKVRNVVSVKLRRNNLPDKRRTAETEEGSSLPSPILPMPTFAALRGKEHDWGRN